MRWTMPKTRTPWRPPSSTTNFFTKTEGRPANGWLGRGFTASGRTPIKTVFGKGTASAVPLRAAPMRALAPEDHVSRQILVPIFPDHHPSLHLNYTHMLRLPPTL